MRQDHAFLRIEKPGIRLSAAVTAADGGEEGFAGIHYHSAFELHVVESGELTLYAQGRAHVIRAGQTCIVGPGVYHYLRGEAGRYELRVDVELTEPGDFMYAPLLSPRVAVYDDPRNAALLREVIEETRLRGPFYREAADACLNLVQVSAARAAGAAPVSARDEGPPREYTRDKIISDFFSDRYASPLRPQELAEQLSVSVRHLDRWLKRGLGLSFKQMLTRTRMEAAKDLLVSTELPVERVAGAVGYNAESNFYRAFRAYEGVTPAEYRAQKRAT